MCSKWKQYHLVGVCMVRFEMKTEPNQTELFAKFKIIELNRTVCISNWTVIIDTVEKIYNKNKRNRILVTELNYSELNQTVLNRTELFWNELNCFSSFLELLVMIQFLLVQFRSSIWFFGFFPIPSDHYRSQTILLINNFETCDYRGLTQKPLLEVAFNPLNSLLNWLSFAAGRREQNSIGRDNASFIQGPGFEPRTPQFFTFNSVSSSH